jgi:zinc protease
MAKSLQRQRRIALSASASLIGTHARDLLVIEGIPAPGTTVEQLEAAITAEIAKLVGEGILPQELSRVKAGLATARLNALQELQGLAEALAENEAARGDPAAFEADIAALDTMDLAAPREAARRWLTPDNMAVLRVLPRATAGGPR